MHFGCIECYNDVTLNVRPCKCLKWAAFTYCNKKCALLDCPRLLYGPIYRNFSRLARKILAIIGPPARYFFSTTLFSHVWDLACLVEPYIVLCKPSTTWILPWTVCATLHFRVFGSHEPCASYFTMCKAVQTFEITTFGNLDLMSITNCAYKHRF